MTATLYCTVTGTWQFSDVPADAIFGMAVAGSYRWENLGYLLFLFAVVSH